MYSTCDDAATTRMTTFEDLPPAAVGLITRHARTRHIPGTNRYARICRIWRDAAVDSGDQEQLQLLLALEGLSPDTVTSTCQWLARHGSCVTSLVITYGRPAADRFQQLHLSAAPLVGLKRLEVDGPDSLMAVAPVLPHLVQLTHLRASIGFTRRQEGNQHVWCVSSSQGQLLEAAPYLQQLCPGLKSLQLCMYVTGSDPALLAPVLDVLPHGLEQLYVSGQQSAGLDCAQLTCLSCLRSLHLAGVTLFNTESVLHMHSLGQVALRFVWCRENEQRLDTDEWLMSRLHIAPQHLGLSKLVTMDILGTSPVMTSLLTSVPNLHSLDLVGIRSGAAAWLQQLSALGALRQLRFSTFMVNADSMAAAVSALSSVQQLTHLFLDVSSIGVQRSAWAAVLPHLNHLRVLGAREELLLEAGLAAEATRLTQLQCLYVRCEGGASTRAVIRNLRQQLQVLSMCSSLKAVLCWSYGGGGAPSGVPLVKGQAEGGVLLSYWHGWSRAAEEGLVVCPRACPHLPGVCELQQVPGDGPHDG